MQYRVMKIIDNLLLEEYLVVITFNGAANMMGNKNGVTKKSKINVFLLQISLCKS